MVRTLDVPRNLSHVAHKQEQVVQCWPVPTLPWQPFVCTRVSQAAGTGLEAF